MIPFVSNIYLKIINLSKQEYTSISLFGSHWVLIKYTILQSPQVRMAITTILL